MAYPRELQKLSQSKLGIVWDDDHCSEFSVRQLRIQCPCASCVDEWTRERRLDPESVPQDIHPVRLETVGRYALQIKWSDGHDTGFYTFDQLRKLCECGQCKNQ